MFFASADRKKGIFRAGCGCDPTGTEFQPPPATEVANPRLSVITVAYLPGLYGTGPPEVGE